LNVLECTYSIFMVYFNVFIIHFNAFVVYFNVFHCISMCLNVFTDIIIRILPSHSHCNVFIMHTHLHIFFSTLHNDSLSNMLYHYIIFFPFSLIHSNFNTIYEKITYQPLLHVDTSPHIPHPTFHVVIGCTEHSRA
jgi:hypothetical protein